MDKLEIRMPDWLQHYRRNMGKFYRWNKELNKFVELARERDGSVAPSVIDDTMPATVHPVTGEYIESKRKFRQRTKASGCVEVGNESLELRPQREDQRAVEDRKRDINEALHKLESSGKLYTKRTIAEQMEYLERRSRG